MFKQAIFYFVALFIIVIIGFWKSYFSQLFGDISFAQHFHAIIMSLWCLLLISQAWLMRAGHRRVHRELGKVAFLLGPLVAIAAFYVAFDFIAKPPQPYKEGVLAIHWFGLFLAVLFVVLFVLAMYYRKTPKLHARYMISTALVFLIPGLGRAIGVVFSNLGLPAPNFFLVMCVPALIGLSLIYMDWKKHTDLTPFSLFTGAWVFNMIMFKALPSASWWNDFTVWSATVMN
jgi:hypothetical protein